MQQCSCGVQLKPFWIWHDETMAPHASAFQPAIKSQGPFYAATPRDALLCVQTAAPKHDVISPMDNQKWEGRCRPTPVTA